MFFFLLLLSLLSNSKVNRKAYLGLLEYKKNLVKSAETV